jgi:anti-sigma B factor antagonist
VGGLSSTPGAFFVGEQAVDERTHVVVAGGELDMRAEGQLRARFDELQRAGRRYVVADLSEVTFIDSTALGVLVRAARRLEDERGSLDIVCANPNVLRVFQIVGLSQRLRIHLAREDAISATRWFADPEPAAPTS